MIEQDRLSAAQRQAVEHPIERPGVVAAGAGTGKTFTIVERVAALHATGQCPAANILLLTFGKKAAAELRNRIVRRLGEEAPKCLTFHAFAWNVLQAHAYDIGMAPETTVIEDAEARVEFRKAFEEYLGESSAPSSGFPLRPFNRQEVRNALFALDQHLKQEGLTLDVFRSRALEAADIFSRVPYRALRYAYRRLHRGATHRTVLEVSDDQFAQEIIWEKQRIEACTDILRRFARRLSARQALTYADILALAERAIHGNGRLRQELQRQYRCCIVDEYQDTDLAQHRLLAAIFGEGDRKSVV